MLDRGDYPDYLGADERNRSDAAIHRIGEALLDGSADFLIGAGVSRESGAPTGDSLASELLARIFPPTGETALSPDDRTRLAATLPFESLAQAVESVPGKKREDLTKSLAAILLDRDYAISDAHRELLTVCNWRGSRPLLDRLFTTNFDLLLEKAFDKKGVSVTEVNTRDIARAQREGKVPIIHLHGKLDEDYEVTEEDLFRDGFSPVKSAFQAALNDADTFVFIGYSMNDPDFRRLYWKFRDEIQIRRKSEKDTYVVGPAGDYHAYSLGNAIWTARRAIWIPLKATPFFSRLRHVLEFKGQEGAKAVIAKKYNLQTDDAFDDMVSRTSNLLRVNKADAIQFLLETKQLTGGVG